MRKDVKDGEVVTHVTREEARGGSSTHVTRYVLGISLVLIIIAFIVVLAFGFHSPSQTGGAGALENKTSSGAQ